MKLSQLINEYITLKRSMGMRFRNSAERLISFCRAMGNIDITEVDSNSVLTFISGKGPVTRSWHEKFSVLSGFYHFAVSRGHINSSPLPTRIPKRPEPMKPYIYTQEELRRLIAVTKMLETRKSPLQATTFRVLLLTLYGTCFRIGEALSLTLADVDLSDSLITVRDTKFHKSRLVPIGPQLTEVLDSYVRKRRQLPQPAGENSAFFVGRTGNLLEYDWVNEVFQRLRKYADIRREDARYQPRMHDIRHNAELGIIAIRLQYIYCAQVWTSTRFAPG